MQTHYHFPHLSLEESVSFSASKPSIIVEGRELDFLLLPLLGSTLSCCANFFSGGFSLLPSVEIVVTRLVREYRKIEDEILRDIVHLVIKALIGIVALHK